MYLLSVILSYLKEKNPTKTRAIIIINYHYCSYVRICLRIGCLRGKKKKIKQKYKMCEISAKKKLNMRTKSVFTFKIITVFGR